MALMSCAFLPKELRHLNVECNGKLFSAGPYLGQLARRSKLTVPRDAMICKSHYNFYIGRPTKIPCVGCGAVGLKTGDVVTNSHLTRFPNATIDDLLCRTCKKKPSEAAPSAPITPPNKPSSWGSTMAAGFIFEETVDTRQEGTSE